MPWIFLLLAGLLEIAWAVGLKHTDGFTRLWPTVWTGIALLVSTGLLALALRTLPVGTAYAIWTGIGTAGTVLFSVLFVGEPVSLAKIACVFAIIAGAVGLKVLA